MSAITPMDEQERQELELRLARVERMLAAVSVALEAEMRPDDRNGRGTRDAGDE